MRIRTITVAVLALICGMSASLAVMRVNRPADGPAVDTVSIIIAAVAIPRGSAIRSDMVMAKSWPKELAPTGAATNLEDVIDRVATSGFVPDEPILEVKLAKPGALGGMPAIIPRGMRTFTVTNASGAVGGAGFILPGHRVDVILTLSSEALSTTLLQNVEVAAVDLLLEAPAENKMERFTSVTLLVTPEQVKMLSLAQDRGKLSLTLRGQDDPERVDGGPIREADLPYMQEDPNPMEVADAPPPAPPPQIQPPQPVLKPVEHYTPPILIRTLRGSAAGLVIVRPESRETTYEVVVPESPQELPQEAPKDSSANPSGIGNLMEALFRRFAPR